MGIAHYLWRAFTSPWNLLAVFGGAAAAVLTPWPDVLLPLIGAGEAIYLGALVSLPRYREAIDAADANKARLQSRAQAPSLNQLLVGLNTDGQTRFNALRKRCLEMRSIARAARPDTVDGTTDAWTPALDRLLYGFLRLLGQQNSLLRFLGLTTVQELTKRRDDLKKRFADAKGSGDDRMIRSLEESTAIADQRLDNYQKAGKNAEFAALGAALGLATRRVVLLGHDVGLLAARQHERSPASRRNTGGRLRHDRRHAGRAAVRQVGPAAALRSGPGVARVRGSERETAAEDDGAGEREDRRPEHRQERSRCRAGAARPLRAQQYRLGR